MSNRLFSVTVPTLLACSMAAAGREIPAVDLPPQVPPQVRDRTARALASARDRLSWQVQPFRGEFHGLGVTPGGSSAAYDLSANGRVVVGADQNAAGGSEGFVWSPWTGRATYDTRPAGVTGDVLAKRISADGVYVAGEVDTPDGLRAFRWSLAGRELISSDAHHEKSVAGISADGGVVVGTDRPSTATSFAEIDHFRSVWASTQFANHAFRFSIDSYETIAPAGSGYWLSEGVDIASDGDSVLVNVAPSPFFDIGGAVRQLIRPAIWRDGELVPIARLSGLAGSFDDADGSQPRPLQSTVANAVSADGRTVVATNLLTRLLSLTDAVSSTERTAVMWRADEGWSDLGELKGPRARGFVGAGATDVSGDGGLVLGNARVALSDVISVVCDCDNPDALAVDVPFLWDQERGMRELRDVLQLDYGLDLSGWSALDATAISDDGTTIVGAGVNPNGDHEAWRAVLHRNTPHGDIDFDGDVDYLDYQTLAANLGATADDGAIFYADGDLNRDGRIDQQDRMALLAEYDFRGTGDFNADGVVDAADYTVWRDYLGQATGVADANQDGWANELDLASWRANLGRDLRGLLVSAPEPGTGGLVLLVLAAALCFGAGVRSGAVCTGSSNGSHSPG